MYDMCIIIGQATGTERFEQLRDAFQPPGRDSWSLLRSILTTIGAITALVLVIHIAGSIQRRRQDGARRRSALALFRDGLRWLGLSWVDRMILLRVARHAKLESPCLLVFTPESLEARGREWSRRLPLGSLRRRAEGRLARLRDRLFTETAEA